MMQPNNEAAVDASIDRAKGQGAAGSLAERLLAALHPTCSHDLPNHVLSLQSLIHLLDWDEAEKLDPEGREYVQRLRVVAEKIEGQANFLKSMVRLVRDVPKPQPMELADLFRELKAAAATVLSERPLAWDIRLAAGTVWADRDLVFASLLDLLKALADGGVAKAVAVTSAISARRRIVQMVVAGQGLGQRLGKIEDRCDVVLARERLCLAGVGLRLGPVRVNELSAIFDFVAEPS